MRMVQRGMSLFISAGGQSKNFPFCDGAHKASVCGALEYFVSGHSQFPLPQPHPLQYLQEYNAAHGTTFAPYVLTNSETEPKTFYVCT